MYVIFHWNLLNLEHQISIRWSYGFPPYRWETITCTNDYPDCFYMRHHASMISDAIELKPITYELKANTTVHGNWVGML